MCRGYLDETVFDGGGFLGFHEFDFVDYVGRGVRRSFA